MLVCYTLFLQSKRAIIFSSSRKENIGWQIIITNNIWGKATTNYSKVCGRSHQKNRMWSSPKSDSYKKSSSSTSSVFGNMPLRKTCVLSKLIQFRTRGDYSRVFLFLATMMTKDACSILFVIKCISFVLDKVGISFIKSRFSCHQRF